MTKDRIYRFIRLDWEAEDKMNETLNTALHAHEEIVQMTSDADEVVLLVATKVKHHV